MCAGFPRHGSPPPSRRAHLAASRPAREAAGAERAAQITLQRSRCQTASQALARLSRRWLLHVAAALRRDLRLVVRRALTPTCLTARRA